MRAAPPKRGAAPNFWPMSIVAKRSLISATAELLFKSVSVLVFFQKSVSVSLFKIAISVSVSFVFVHANFLCLTVNQLYWGDLRYTFDAIA